MEEIIGLEEKTPLTSRKGSSYKGSDSGHPYLYYELFQAFETLHYLKRKSTGKLGYMALKLDMSKAYDRVEWEFLEKIMHHLGLDEKII